MEFLEIDLDWSRKLPEALETNFKWFWSHGKPSKAISKNAKILWKMDPTGRHLVEILRCRYAAAQCLKDGPAGPEKRGAGPAF